LVTGEDKIDFIVCEVKTSRCDLNESWLSEGRQNVEYVIRWMGFEDDGDAIRQIARDVYKTGICESAGNGCSVRFVTIGSTENPDPRERLPRVTLDPLHRRILGWAPWLRQPVKTLVNT
jgi:hypothetical protein